MADKEAELTLLATFIPQAPGSEMWKKMLTAWRRGDAETLARLEEQSSSTVPSLRERLIATRNRNWIPKIEGYLHDRHTYFVVAGAAHMGGPNGVLTILR
jgi:uncharacterized protein YbaP (TraB family)